MTILEAMKQLRDDLKLWVTNNLRVKMDKNLGTDNAGKVLAIDEEGNIVPVENNAGGNTEGSNYFTITVVDGVADKTYEDVIDEIVAHRFYVDHFQVIEFLGLTDDTVTTIPLPKQRIYEFSSVDAIADADGYEGFDGYRFVFTSIEDNVVYNCSFDVAARSDHPVDSNSPVNIIFNTTVLMEEGTGAGGDCAFTDGYKSAIDNYVLEVDLNGADAGDGTEGWQGYFDVDDTLSLVGVAADAKKTGDELARLNKMLGGSSVSDQIADAIVEVYVQDIEPADAPAGSIWVDTGTPGLDDAEDTTAKVYLIDAGTSDISSLDLSSYKAGDVIIVTTS